MRDTEAKSKEQHPWLCGDCGSPQACDVLGCMHDRDLAEISAGEAVLVLLAGVAVLAVTAAAVWWLL